MQQNLKQSSARVHVDRAYEQGYPILFVIPEAHSLSRHFDQSVQVERLRGVNDVSEWERDRHRKPNGQTRKLYAKAEPQSVRELFSDLARLRGHQNAYLVCNSRMRALGGLGFNGLEEEFNQRSGLLYKSQTLLVGFPRIIGERDNRDIAYPYKAATSDDGLRQAPIQWKAMFDQPSDAQLKFPFVR